MKFLFPLLAVALAVGAQTPLEFAIVKDLVQGTPHVSVISIEIQSGTPASGCSTLRLAARAGLLVSPRLHTIYPDTTGLFSGQTLFGLDVEEEPVERVFSVVSEECRAFRGTGVTHLALDLVSYDDMSWLSLECPLGLADSVARGLLPFSEVWNRCEIGSLEIGTAAFALDFAPPVDVDRPVFGTADTISAVGARNSGQAWKSLVLPGWGQLSTGEGMWWFNLLVEAGGIGLAATGNEREGIAILGANHLLSFFDLL
jgi:hypothetical protein